MFSDIYASEAKQSALWNDSSLSNIIILKANIYASEAAGKYLVKWNISSLK